MKGQVSTELLVIVALVLLIFIPLLVLVYFKANDANQQIASYQAELSVSRIASLSNSVGSLGTNTSVTTDIFIPQNTERLSITNAGGGSEISLELETPQGSTEIVEVIKYPLEADVELADSSAAGGWMRIKVTSTYEGGRATLTVEQIK
ncbi:hypothetical protein KKB44_04915 [Candidatus Micrarchaeota archaeon]|nr:hypothetical protein [Candidatus Micrarchaeota archaeon]